MPTDPASCPYVGRGGLKLRHALDAFDINPAGLTCADFGCNVGGFTDCLLRGGAAKVFAIDTGYGSLAWTLRNDPRVVVMERTNALHADPPAERIDLITIDMAWTPQRLCIPAALRWLGVHPRGRAATPPAANGDARASEHPQCEMPGALEPAQCRRIAPRGESPAAPRPPLVITLIKPHYEASHGLEKHLLRAGILDEPAAQAVLDRVLSEIPTLGAALLGVTRSPITGGASKKNAEGNVEYLALLSPRLG